MKKNIKLFYILCGLIGALLLAGCGTSGSSSGSVSVYGGYGYPAYGYGYNSCCYSQPVVVRPPTHRPPGGGRPERPSKPPSIGRPVRPSGGGGGRRR